MASVPPRSKGPALRAQAGAATIRGAHEQDGQGALAACGVLQGVIDGVHEAPWRGEGAEGEQEVVEIVRVHFLVAVRRRQQRLQQLVRRPLDHNGVLLRGGGADRSGARGGAVARRIRRGRFRGSPLRDKDNDAVHLLAQCVPLALRHGQAILVRGHKHQLAVRRRRGHACGGDRRSASGDRRCVRRAGWSSGHDGSESKSFPCSAAPCSAMSCDMPCRAMPCHAVHHCMSQQYWMQPREREERPPSSHHTRHTPTPHLRTPPSPLQPQPVAWSASDGGGCGGLLFGVARGCEG